MTCRQQRAEAVRQALRQTGVAVTDDEPTEAELLRIYSRWSRANTSAGTNGKPLTKGQLNVQKRLAKLQAKAKVPDAP